MGWAGLVLFLRQMIAEQEVCHKGEPDYPNLYSFRKSNRRVGPVRPHSIHSIAYLACGIVLLVQYIYGMPLTIP